MLNHALANFSEFKTNTFTINYEDQTLNYFGDHFSPIMYLYVPFYYVFQDYALLVVQILSILVGGFGVLKLASLYFKNKWIPTLVLIQFFTLWGIGSALAVGFHNNVVGSMFIPWFLYYYKINNFRNVFLITLLILLSKENMAVLLSPLILVLIIWNKDRMWRDKVKFEIPLFIFSLVFFVVTLQYIMPFFNDFKELTQINHFKYLGETTTEIFWNIVSEPGKIIELFYTNNSASPGAEIMKEEFYYVLLISGGVLFLTHPKYLIIAIPLLMQKCFLPNFTVWGINGHYSIEFVPIISFALIESLSKLKFTTVKLVVVSGFIASSLYIHQSKIQQRDSKWYSREDYDFMSEQHYLSKFDVVAIQKALDLIPNHVPVSTTSFIGAHIPNREKLYHFPTILDSEYIVLLKGNSYPLNLPQFEIKLNELLISNEFETLFNNDEIYVFKKR